jgi:hypothetical protein
MTPPGVPRTAVLVLSLEQSNGSPSGFVARARSSVGLEGSEEQLTYHQSEAQLHERLHNWLMEFEGQTGSPS